MRYLFCAALFLFLGCHDTDKWNKKIEERNTRFKSECPELMGHNYLHTTEATLFDDGCRATVQRDWEYCQDYKDYNQAAERACEVFGEDYNCKMTGYKNGPSWSVILTYDCYAGEYAE